MLLKNGDSGVQVKYLQQGLRIMCCNPEMIIYYFKIRINVVDIYTFCDNI